jgi:hypothetical protein
VFYVIYIFIFSVYRKKQLKRKALRALNFSTNKTKRDSKVPRKENY